MIQSWTDFCVAMARLGDKAKGDAFEALVKRYLETSPLYCTKLRHVWLHRQVPARVRQKINLPAKDQGIDLVAETFDGEYWAIQAKFRTDEQSCLSWTELSTFAGLAYAVCRQIKFALVCTTTERVTRILHGLPGKVGFRTNEVWRSLAPECFAELKVGRPPVRLRPFTPRPHQRAAIASVLRGFRKTGSRRGKLLMPCGSGKSHTAYWIATELDAKTILIAVPSLALIRQTLGDWLREVVAQRRVVEWICVCSDQSAGKPELDELTAFTHELGVPCATEPAHIARWLRTHRDKTRVVFTTYQSGEAISDAARQSKTRFDLAIMDEAHKTVGQRSSLFNHLGAAALVDVTSADALVT